MNKDEKFWEIMFEELNKTSQGSVLLKNMI